MFLDMRQNDPVGSLPLTGLAAAISPQATFPDIQHIAHRLALKESVFSSMNLNLNTFGPQRTALLS